MVTKPKGHAFQARVPDPLFEAVQKVSALTGSSVNSLVVQGLELVVETFNTTAPASTTMVASIDSIRGTYASTGGAFWSTSTNSGAPLASWTATSAHQQAIDALAGTNEGTSS